MIGRFIFIVFLFVAITSCGGDEISGIGKYKTTTIDTTDMYYTGEYYSIGDLVYFKDCATNRVMNLRSDKMKEIEALYFTTSKGSPTFCSLRGEFNSEDSILKVRSFLGFNITDECIEEKLNKTYAFKGDTLTLTDDYKYTFMINGSETIRGNWARQYRDVGVLSLGDANGIKFVINVGLRSNNNNLFLSIMGTDGVGMVFMPI